MTTTTTMPTPKPGRRAFVRACVGAACGAAALLPLGGCAPLLIGGAMLGGGLVVTDRRTAGTQLEDEAIELKATSRAQNLATLGRVDIVSYNRMVLLTGEVPTESDRAAVARVVGEVENVRSVVNELTVGENLTLAQRSSDAVLLGKIKATMVDTKDLQANAFKVVVVRGTVYLLGRVTAREADRGTEVARSVPGVRKVVRVLEVLTEAELSSLATSPAPTTAPKPATGATPAR